MALSHPEMGSSTLAVLNYDNIHVFRGLYYFMVGFHVLNPGRKVKPKSLGVV